jgi:perosamine synthetase
VPVHLGGAAADLDAILAAARRRGVPLVEDACQAHLGEWRGRKVGTYGKGGCFSFQASKNLNAGEGGAILTADADLLEACYEFHNNSRGRGQRGADFSYRGSGANLRMTEFQGALLLAQMTRLEEQARTCDRNGAYLTSLLRKIPGITPARMYEGCTRNAYHLYMLRYDKEHFAGLPRSTACARRRCGSPRRCCSDLGRTWSRSQRRSARSRPMRAGWRRFRTCADAEGRDAPGPRFCFEPS